MLSITIVAMNADNIQIALHVLLMKDVDGVILVRLVKPVHLLAIVTEIVPHSQLMMYVPFLI